MFMGEVSKSDTPLKATFKVRLNGETVTLATVGQAYREWMEFRSLHGDAVAALERAAGNAMLTVQATNALRTLFVRAKLL